jgi:hypothetical protein
VKLLVTATALTLVALGLTACNETAPVKPAQRALDEAESSCLTAVARQVGASEVSTISAERGENATIVLVRVPGAQAPWRCEYGATGVQRVFYTGEG